jgi:hypothetical protein
MTFTLALRSLLAHPVRSAVLAAGFGVGVAVMAILLGVAEVILEQATSPVLVGGGDVVITGAGGDVTAARVLLLSTLHAPPLAARVRAVSPWSRTTLYLVRPGSTTPVRTRGGIPSAERALRDPETAAIESWRDDPADRAWTAPEPGDVLRAIDRFHPVPDVPARASSWAEWLYFNGRAPAGRFYLTFLVGPLRPDGTHSAGVRLQLDRNGRVESFTETTSVDTSAVATAPNITIGRSRVQINGLRYRIAVNLRGPRGSTAIGELFIESTAGRVMPPLEIHGRGGWVSGYVVPVMSGILGGTLSVNGEPISFDGGSGYHDHNWGFWEGVSWQWGQVQQHDVSLVFGRVFPPQDAADPERIPGFLAALGPNGPIGYATNVTIVETDNSASRPARIVIRGRSRSLDLTLAFDIDNTVINPMSSGPFAGKMDFLQMRGRYNVSGKASDRALAFTASGSAETFRGR